MSQLGDGPVDAAHVEAMNVLMRAADETFNGKKRPRKVGVVMLVFPYDGHDGRCNFISNGADRKDLVVLFKEMISRFEGQPEVSGRA